MALNHDALKQRRERRAGSGWKPREGPNKIRILPARSIYLTQWELLEDAAIPYKMHFFKIEGRTPTEVSRCLNELKQPCPACKVFFEHRKSADPGLAEMAKKVGPSDQYLFNILDLGNVQKGVQHWTANYTCWDKIMEVVANAAWGNVLDPANGVNFEINMTPGNRSRTGWNQYSVMPEPLRTTVMPILDTIPNWQTELDSLEEQITPAKDAAEIEALLQAIGLPVAGASRPVGVPATYTAQAPAAAPAPFLPPAAAPAAVPFAAPAPAAVPAVTPAMPAVAPVPVAAPAPAPVAVPAATPAAHPVTMPPAAPPVESRANVASVFAPTTAAPPTVHYDPGPDFIPAVADEERPTGAPRCFGAYDPRVHRCQPCPIVAECQLKMLDAP